MTKISEYLKAHDMTHEAFAALVDITRPHLTKIANGSAYPSRKLMVRIAKVTNGQVPITSWFEAAE
jgi:transcriptional regulator with XRE-family HTH domain